MTTTTETDTRAEYIAGLRQLADLLDANAFIPLPTDGHLTSISICFFGDDAEANRQRLTQFARVFPGDLDKDMRETEYGDYFDLTGQLCGVTVKATAFRQQICQRVVTGTREVTEEVPDPAALAEVPKVTVTKTVEDVEWQCEPLLAERVSA